MNDYTPGPWRAIHWEHKNAFRIIPVDVRGMARSDGPVADVFFENEANAYLIAAAPELYTALKNLVNEIAVMGDVGWYNEDGGFVRKAQQALALADTEI